MIGRSGNPTLKESTFERAGTFSGMNAMTIEGTVNKAFITLIILLGSAFSTWMLYFDGYNVVPMAIGGALVGLILALIVSFAPKAAPFLVPVYAVAEGMFLGAISAQFEQRIEPGITLNAILLTMGVFFALLIAYKTRLIKATENFKLGVVAATGGIALVYLINFILGFFGMQVPFLHESSWIGIGISVVIVIIAALNLVLDFDFIENGAAQGAPKYMEWYGAFGLMVTLVWLYLEIIRLLAKLAASRD
ncbi:Bax inhibitor-1/YccA family protein [Paenibacillus sp. alder61]|uniref:Bax inhibitor-1/YccA family protein n=1 Tax=Paenibacillus faecis TaxID=862114 RepID=A0A5D0CQE8_9BACL|nr:MULTISPECIES: Bax inhibitor-1/YccA family protein [Paenibacillus]MCA1293480.1 Bax inhibitor-1/YccA family protein [Paenibacillus sp. alder61]TYA12131.1 Bax inhibitor-1/YccA family protein [Paenibacillus faecis]